MFASFKDWASLACGSFGVSIILGSCLVMVAQTNVAYAHFSPYCSFTTGGCNDLCTDYGGFGCGAPSICPCDG